MEPRHVIVSGGSRGLGATLVSGLLGAGYRVSAFSRRPSEFTEQLAGNERFFFAPADLCAAPSLTSFLKTAEAAFGVPYGLVNSAAIAFDGVLATMAEDSMEKLLSVNLMGTLRLTKLVVRRMLLGKAGGVILNISSISSLRGYKGMTAYALTKGGIDALTRALARELGGQRIRVNSIAPGHLETEMTRELNEEQRQQILHRTPLGRLGVAGDVLGPVLFLLSDQASFITGQVLVVDGGNTI